MTPREIIARRVLELGGLPDTSLLYVLTEQGLLLFHASQFAEDWQRARVRRIDSRERRLAAKRKRATA